MTVSLKTQSQSRGQYSLRARCRYCGNSWLPFPEKALNPPLSASVKCPRCKSKQHLHWIGRLAAVSPSAGEVPFPSLKSVDFEEKKITLPKVEIPATNAPAAEIKQNAVEVAPLPELKERSETKRENRPIFKSRLNPAGERPIFKASSRFQTKLKAPTPAKPESKPPAPAPTREIKIDFESKSKEEPRDEPFTVNIERHEVIAHEPETRKEVAARNEIAPVKNQIEPVEEPPSQKSETKKLEPQHVQEPDGLPLKKEVQEIHSPEVAPNQEPEVRPEPKSMFKPSLFKPASPRPMFKSRLRHDLKRESAPPSGIPEAGDDRVEIESTAKIEPEEKKEKPNRTRRRELFPQKKAEVEIRESPLDDEIEGEKAPEAPSPADNSEKPKQVFSSGWAGKKRPKRKIFEESGEIDGQEI